MPERKPIQDPEDIELREDRQLEAVIGRPPGWLLHWGMTLVALAFVVLIVLSAVIEYPDVLQAPVTVLSEQPPVRVVARTSGKLTRLLVQDGQFVRQGDLLAELENPARLQDVETLSSFIEDLQALENPLDFLEVQLPENLQLGELQPDFAQFAQNLEDYQYFLSQGTVFQKINSLEQQIRRTRELIRLQGNQLRKLEEEVALARENFERYRRLSQDGAVSDVEAERAEVDYLRKERALEQLKTTIVNHRIRIEELRVEIADLKQSRQDGRSSRQLLIRQDIRRLQSAVEAWRQRYLLLAPITGRVAFTRVLSEQQFLKAEEPVLTIVPEGGEGDILGRALLPMRGAGKVRAGQRVSIRLEGYPYQQFGTLDGRVAKVALVPEESSYLLEVDLPDTLRTTYGQTIPFRQEMQGTALVITEERSFLARIFDRILSVWKNP
ncbi:MAG: HlyD family efflux transporter periplasmic adaptor subunit [Bacteroidetes bacterium]|nr:MAG: HlyD family efflux transporter periplasmic adaptor subunit [Bacteroidota bacterium]